MVRHPSVLLQIAGVVGFVGTAAAPAAAQWWWPPQWEVDPACPHPSASIIVRVSGQWPDLCPPDQVQATRLGNEIDLRVSNPQSGPCMLPAISSYSLPAAVGALPAGTYHIYATHYFQSVPSTPRTFLGVIEVSASCPLPCYANCDGSTNPPVLNVADFGCFLSRYAAGDSYANCDGSTIPPVLNVADFGCFLAAYAAGCE
jgi:hypothetical protein